MNDETPIPALGGNMPEYSVSELSGLLKKKVEDTFPYVRVRGEISSCKRHTSGHCYFDLKDERAVLAGVVWKMNFARLAVKPEQGLEVVCTGRLTTYPGQSKYQLVVEDMELAGLGALMAMLELRRKKLAAEGLFDESRKKKLPFLPRVIGVVTSPTGAVIRDIMHRLRDRCPRPVLLWPVNVQGERAPADIAAAIRGFNRLAEGGSIPRPDVLIVARGGGSIEDLLAFSDEDVVRAAAESEIPLISAVGHETDTTLIDFASDRRAPTPTAAAEMAVPVLRDLAEMLLSHRQRILRSTQRAFERRRQELSGLSRALPRADALFSLPRQRFDSAAERLRGALVQNTQRHHGRFTKSATLLRPRILQGDIATSRESALKLEERMERAFRHRIANAARALQAGARVLESVSYKAVLSRGFALVRDEKGGLRRKASDIAANDKLVLAFTDGEVRAQALSSSTSPTRAAPPKSAKPPRGQGDLF